MQNLQTTPLKTYMEFVLFYSLPKNDVNLQKKNKNHEPSWRTKTWRASFFTTAVVHGLLK